MNPVLVHPGRLVCVHVETPEGNAMYRCVSCRYVQVQGPGIGVELIYDPANLAPGASYYLPAENLQTVELDPEQIVRIHPYGTE